MSRRDDKAIQAELDGLKKEGLINPHDVVDFARNPGTALHSQFTWDDTEAAHKWRLEQARELLRVFVVISPQSTENVRAFVSLKGDRVNGGGYRPIADVLSDEELHRRMLQDSLDDLEAYQRKYQKLEELKPIFAAAERVAKKHRRRKVA
jgi:hypothetical protein